MPLANETAFSGSIPWTRNGFRYFLKRNQFILSGYSQFSKILSLKFQFHSILPKALRSICLNGLHLRNTAFRIVWKLSQEFEVFESFAPVPIFPGFLVGKKAFEDTGADLGGEGVKGAAPPFFPCIFEKRKLTNERDYSFGPSSEFSGSVPGTRFSRKPQNVFKWKVAESHLVMLKLMRHDCSFIKHYYQYTLPNRK